MKIVKKTKLQLLTSSDMITWKNYKFAITMNLIFIFLIIDATNNLLHDEFKARK